MLKVIFFFLGKKEWRKEGKEREGREEIKGREILSFDGNKCIIIYFKVLLAYFRRFLDMF